MLPETFGGVHSVIWHACFNLCCSSVLDPLALSLSLSLFLSLLLLVVFRSPFPPLHYHTIPLYTTRYPSTQWHAHPSWSVSWRSSKRHTTLTRVIRAISRSSSLSPKRLLASDRLQSSRNVLGDRIIGPLLSRLFWRRLLQVCCRLKGTIKKRGCSHQNVLCCMRV